MRLSIGQKVKRRCHVSAFRASKDTVPYLKIIFKNNVEMAAGLARWLDLDAEMVAYLAGSEEKAEEINKLLG